MTHPNDIPILETAIEGAEELFEHMERPDACLHTVIEAAKVRLAQMVEASEPITIPGISRDLAKEAVDIGREMLDVVPFSHGEHKCGLETLIEVAQWLLDKRDVQPKTIEGLDRSAIVEGGEPKPGAIIGRVYEDPKTGDEVYEYDLDGRDAAEVVRADRDSGAVRTEDKTRAYRVVQKYDGLYFVPDQQRRMDYEVWRLDVRWFSDADRKRLKDGSHIECTTYYPDYPDGRRVKCEEWGVVEEAKDEQEAQE